MTAWVTVGVAAVLLARFAWETLRIVRAYGTLDAIRLLPTFVRLVSLSQGRWLQALAVLQLLGVLYLWFFAGLPDAVALALFIAPSGYAFLTLRPPLVLFLEQASRASCR